LKLPSVEKEVVVAGMKPTAGTTAPAQTKRSMVIALPSKSKDAMLVYDGDGAFGSPGGPVCDQFGSVVAIHDKDLNLVARRSGAGIPIEAVTKLLPMAQLPHPAPTSVELRWDEVSSRADKATVIVLGAARGQDVSLNKRIGPYFQEDCTCNKCKGTALMDCPVKGCVRGVVTKEVSRPVGRDPNTRQIIYATSQEGFPCTECNGLGRVKCKACDGKGVDPELSDRPSGKYGIKNPEDISPDESSEQPTSDKPSTPTHPSKPKGRKK
jgi:hypothetical protein